MIYSGTGGLTTDTLNPVSSATWTLKNPLGVTKPILDTAAGLNGNYVYFVPDTVGDWTVTMTATTAKGTIKLTAFIDRHLSKKRKNR